MECGVDCRVEFYCICHAKKSFTQKKSDTNELRRDFKLYELMLFKGTFVLDSDLFRLKI